MIDRAREGFSSQSLRMRLGLSLLRLFYDAVQGQEFDDRRAPPKFSLLEMMLNALRGNIHKYAQRLGQYIRYIYMLETLRLDVKPLLRHLDECQLTTLLDQLHELFEHPPLLKDQKRAREEVSGLLSLVIDKVKPVQQVARDLCEWLEEYLECVRQAHPIISCQLIVIQRPGGPS